MRILQLLQWNLKDILPNISLIKEQGFDTLQISPMQGTKEDGSMFWLLYQPTSLKIGNSQIGSKEDLKTLCSICKEYGIKVIVDVVLRHVAGSYDNPIVPHYKVDTELQDDSLYLEPRTINDYNNRWESINLCLGMPALNYYDKRVQKLHIKYLDELKECGVGGFRVDMAKHIALAHEGCDWWSTILRRYSDMIVYGEVIQADRSVLESYANTIGLIGTDGYVNDKNKMITWVESHDDHLTWGHSKKMSDDMIIHEYGILTNTYKNTLFYCRPYSNAWKDYRVKLANGSV